MALASRNLGQLRIRRDIEPPALVIGQMQVKVVQLVPGQKVEETVQVVDLKHASRKVEQRAAPAEARRIPDLAGHRQHELGRALTGTVKNLSEGHKGIEEARSSGGENRDLVPREDDAVGFVGHGLDTGDTARAGIGKQRACATEQPRGKIPGGGEGEPRLGWPFHQRQRRHGIARAHCLHRAGMRDDGDGCLAPGKCPRRWPCSGRRTATACTGHR